MGTYLDQTELYLFNEGKSAYAYRALGCHRVTMEDGGISLCRMGAERAERERGGFFQQLGRKCKHNGAVLHHGRLAGAYKKRLRGGFIQIRNIYGG